MGNVKLMNEIQGLLDGERVFIKVADVKGSLTSNICKSISTISPTEFFAQNL